MESNIYDIDHTASSRMKVVVIGGGFAGLNFVKHLDLAHYDVTLVDRNNYHSFPPLFYQVASSGLDPASICFPLRRELRKRHKGRVRFNMGEVESIDTVRRRVRTPLEDIPYDILVVAAGTTNNFFNMGYLEDCVYTMKSTAEALRCRNDILALLERASLASTSEEREVAQLRCHRWRPYRCGDCRGDRGDEALHIAARISCHIARRNVHNHRGGGQQIVAHNV